MESKDCANVQDYLSHHISHTLCFVWQSILYDRGCFPVSLTKVL